MECNKNFSFPGNNNGDVMFTHTRLLQAQYEQKLAQHSKNEEWVNR